MTLNRQWLLKARPHGMIGPDNFEYTETPIPQIGDGEILVQNQYLSFECKHLAQTRIFYRFHIQIHKLLQYLGRPCQ